MQQNPDHPDADEDAVFLDETEIDRVIDIEDDQEPEDDDDDDDDDGDYLDEEEAERQRVGDEEEQVMDEDQEEGGAEGGEDDEAMAEKKRLEAPPEGVKTAFIGHDGPIHHVAVHPVDADLVATASEDDTAALWRVSTGKRVFELKGHSDTVVSVAFNAAGTYLATAGMDSTVKVWNVADGSLVLTLDGPGEEINWVVWHPRGDVVLAGSADFTVWMWNVPSGNIMRVFAGHSASVLCGGFTKDGKFVVSGCADGNLRIFNPRNDNPVASFGGIGSTDFHEEAINHLDLSEPDHVLTASADGTARLLHINTENDNAVVKVVGTFRGHTDSVEDARYSARLRLVATGSLDGKVHVHDLRRADLPPIAGSHEAGVVSVAWHPSLDILLSTSLDCSLRLWQARTLTPIQIFKGHVDSILDLAVSGDGSYAVTAADDAAALVWNLLL